MERVNDFMPSIDGHIEVSTFKVRYRRYRQLARIFEDMKRDPEYTISTTNPRDIKADDIKEFVKYRRKRDVAPVTILDDLTYLRDLLEAYDNFSVSQFKSKYRKFWPRKFKKKPRQLPPTHYQRIVSRASELVKSDAPTWELVRAYAVVMWPLMGGLRPQEIQHAQASFVDDLESGIMRIWLEHVKGSGSYGEPRYAPILPEGYEFCKRYLQIRAATLKARGVRSDALIPKHESSGQFLSYQKMNRLKIRVEEDLGINFPLTILRATWIMKLKKMGIRGEDASLAAGHHTTNTTEEDYYRKENEDALEDIFKVFREQARERAEHSQENIKKSISAKTGKLNSENRATGHSEKRTGGDSNPRPAA